MILITGGAGYIGSHCALEFLNADEKIVIFDSLENGHIETINALKKIGNFDFVQGDLKNIDDVEKLFKNYQIDTVIHFAGYIQVEESVKNPQKYFENNVGGTLNLLNSMVKYGVKKIVFSSTCAIYGEPEYIPLDENHKKNPVNPYGETKLEIEKYLVEYDEKYGIKSICLRYFNVAGADSETRIGEWHEPETHLIPNILNNKQTFKIFGDDYDTKDGTCIRDYVNVEDLAKAHKLACEYLNKENKSDCFNLGSEKGYSVKEVFDCAEKIIGKKIDYEIMPRREGDAVILLANSTKAKKILGWSSEKTLEESIKTAYLWYNYHS